MLVKDGVKQSIPKNTAARVQTGGMDNFTKDLVFIKAKRVRDVDVALFVEFASASRPALMSAA